MKITVCELRNTPDEFAHDWEALVAHVKAEASELVLLPEMPFYPWIAWIRQFEPATWQASVKAHEEWMLRLQELAPAIVIGSRPVSVGNTNSNEGFLWEPENGYQVMHAKYYLPDEEGFWEASWYGRSEREFIPALCRGMLIGMQICTELWFSEHARDYGKAGAHLIVCPRATPVNTTEKWVAGGRTTAVVSGAYCLSSNFGGTDAHGMQWGGTGWIIEPEEGEVLARTSQETPFVTLDIDLKLAEQAKNSYPRYVLE